MVLAGLLALLALLLGVPRSRKEWVLVAAVTLTSSWAFAQGGGELNLINLTNLDELSQLAHFQEVEGGCRFYGELNKASGDVQIEVKACVGS